MIAVCDRTTGQELTRGTYEAMIREALGLYQDGRSFALVDTDTGETVATDSALAEWLMWTRLQRAGWVR